MGDDIHVREARTSDARAIAEVSVASRTWSYRDLLPAAVLDRLSVEEAEAVFTEALADLPPTSAVFVAERQGRVIGYSNLHKSPDTDVPPGTSELGGLYVTEDAAGTGAGRALTDAATERARDGDQKTLTLWVRRENTRARRFYEKHGGMDGAERSSVHPVLGIEIHEVRYRMLLCP